MKGRKQAERYKKEDDKKMTAEELHNAGQKLYGEGLSASMYIRALSEDLETPESTVRKWWYGLRQGIPSTARVAIGFMLQSRDHLEGPDHASSALSYSPWFPVH